MYRNPVGKPCRQLAFPYAASNQVGLPVPRMSGPGAGTGTGQSIGSLQGTAGVLSRPALQGYTGIFAGSRRSSHGHEGDNQDNADIRLVDLTPDTVSDAKHQQRFAKFKPADWARIQTILTDGNWVGQGENRWRISMTDGSGKPWRVVVKKTSAGELLLVTYHRSNIRGQARREGGSGGA